MFTTNFPYSAEELSAFVLSIDTFIISLKTGQVIKHATKDIEPFYQWLVVNNVRDIARQKVAIG
jgi:sRNA-binding regulator protein Hfq